MPLVQIKNYQRGIAKRLNVNAAPAQQLAARLKKSAPKEDCWALYEGSYLPEDQIAIYPLNRQNVLVEAPCWRAAKTRFRLQSALRYGWYAPATGRPVFSQGG